MSILNAADARPDDIHILPVGGRDVRNSSNSFALLWRVISSEVEKLKWFCFDVALKLAVYTYKKYKKKQTKKKTVTKQCVLPSRWQVSLVSVRILAS